MKNPKWTREEVILLVDLFFETEGKISLKDDKLKQISYFSRELHYDKLLNSNFRNAKGIFMKLKNILYLHTDGKEGLSSYSRLDKEIYDEFKNNKELLRKSKEEILKEF